MSEVTAPTRLSKAAKEFNISVGTIVEFLKKKGMEVENNPNAKITAEQYALLVKEFQSEKTAKEQSRQLGLEHTRRETVSIEDRVKIVEEPEPEQEVVVIKDLKTTLRRETEIKPAEPVITKPVPKPETLKAETPAPEIEKPVVIETEVKKEEATELVKESTEEKKPQEKEIPKAGQPELKILGKIDIDTVSGKSAKKKEKSEPTPTPPFEDKQPQPDVESQIETEKEIPVAETTETEKPVEIQQEEVTEQPEEITSDTMPAEEKETDDNFIKTQYVKLTGPVIMGKMDLPVAKPVEKKPVASSKEDLSSKKKKRKRIKPATTVSNEVEKTKDASEKKHQGQSKHREKGRKEAPKPVLSDEEIQKQIKETLARLSTPSKSKASKYRRAKREAISQHMQEELEKAEQEKSILRVTEFVTANEFASLMNVPVTSVIQTCMNLGIFVSINQRLDAETIAIVAEEFGFKVEFVTAEVQEVLPQYEDNPADHVERAPIVTVMGHVDHGKTSLLDFIRNSNVIAGEAGGITQHIGAYEVKLENGKKITFLDTPGHEAFTAMRARGAKITDVAVIVIAADDSVMPQTIEAINHAQAAGVPIVFAINKIDKPNADPERIKQQLANMNLLVEDWGGKIQSQEISAKKGVNMDLLLEKILLEAEILELKANPKRPAEGTIIESSLDKGRGYVAKILVQNGTLRVGDIVLAGTTFGRVKAMYNERNQIVKEAGPSSAVLMLGLNGAPQAGDSFLVMLDERDAKNIAFKRQQLQREQGIRAQKHITLDEIGRRIAIGDFKELNLIVKGDVDGSVEALADSLIKLGNQQVQVNVIHKSVGQVTESDVLLASASNAIIVGFQVRPSLAARKLAEQEQIDIRLYSIIYTAIEEIKSAIEGMLAPEIQEKITGNAEIREVFKISKVGSVAGCFVLDGKFTRNTKIRVIRDGIVIYTGNLSSLKRFKDDVKEVSKGMECGMSVERFNDIKVGDIIEGYEEIEIKRTL